MALERDPVMTRIILLSMTLTIHPPLSRLRCGNVGKKRVAVDPNHFHRDKTQRAFHRNLRRADLKRSFARRQLFAER